jgi:integrase
LRFVRGYPQRTTIGKLEEVSIEEARGRADELNAGLARWKLVNYNGASPFQTRRDPTLDDLVDHYVEKHVKAHAARPERAEKDIDWKVEKYLESWRTRKAGSISKADVVDLHARIGSKSGRHSANRVVQFLRALFYWAKKAGISDGENPAAGVTLFHEPKRTRYLEPIELPLFFLALRKEKNVDLRDFVNLAMWTGARKNDVLSMRWESVSVDDNRWLIPDPKNRTPYTVALTPEAVAILRDRKKGSKDSPWVFPSRGRTGHIVDLKTAWKKLLKRAGLTGKDFRIHDLRRTLGSYQAAQGTSLNIIGKSLGHKSLAATQIYAQLDLDPVRASVMSATRTMIAASKKKPKLLQNARR